MNWIVWAGFGAWRMFAALILEYGFFVGCSLSYQCFEPEPICYYSCKIREALHIDMTDYLKVDPIFSEGALRIRLAAGLFGILSPLVCLMAWRKYKKQDVRDLALVLASILGSYLVLYGIEQCFVSPNPALVVLFNVIDILLVFALIQEVITASPTRHIKQQ